jgi:hypothetical protein
MGVVKWLGRSNYWDDPEDSGGDPRFVMPLTEQAVFDVANWPGGARRLSLQAAVNCTSRLAMRVALAATGLNPAWRPVECFDSSVVKAPASVANLGVRFLPPNEYTEALRSAAPDLARFGIVEELVDGPQYEVDGFVLGRCVSHFHPLLQHWNEGSDEILRYERKVPPGQDWRPAVLTTLRAVGLCDSPFCLEMRLDHRTGSWRVIEIHARLGADPGLGELMWDRSPLRVIEQACAAQPPSRGDARGWQIRACPFGGEGFR